MERGSRRRDRIALVLLGVLVGAILVSPAAAHVGETIDHLWGAPGHIKSKVQTFGDARYMRFGPNAYLKPGKMLTGTLSARSEVDGYLIDDASFQMPLNFSPTVILVDNDGATPRPAQCEGTVNAPKADPGYLCVYAGFISTGDAIYDGYWDPVDGSSCGCRRGIVVYYQNSSGGYAEATGTWAVRAPAAGVASPVGGSSPSGNRAGTGAN
jgi:hypothetical protein